MEHNKFYEELAEKLPLPFDIEDVEELEENCWSIWVTLYSGDVYSVLWIECEEDDLSD